MKNNQKIRMVFTLSTLAILSLIVLIAGSAPALAQSGGSKDTQKLQKSVEDSRGSLQDAVDQIKETMAQYNALMAGDAKKPNKIYKDLSKSTDECDKAAKDVKKSVESMHKDLEKNYKAWEKEIESYSSDSMKERSKKSLDQVKAKFGKFDTTLQEASELYKPFIASLHDQVAYMGRDLSPAALGELKDEAATLNENAEALYAKVDDAIAATQPGAEDSEATESDETAEEDAGGEEGASDETAGEDTEDAGSDAPGEETPDE